MQEKNTKFSLLFKRYRLKSEFSTLSQFGLSLAEKGLIYEDSIFSHWQLGTRIPQQRETLLKLLEIFIEKRAITTIGQANEFLTSCGQGYLSEKELERLPVKLTTPAFQVPHEVSNFIAREEIIENILRQESILGNVFLLYGPMGVGKTALAIKLGHLLKDKFEDGVLWYKVEEDNLQDILLSIAKTFGEDIGQVTNLNVRSTIVRSLLAGKNVLLILDNIDKSNISDMLIPNSRLCTIIITSRTKNIDLPSQVELFEIKPFTKNEVLKLFKTVLKDKYKESYNEVLLQVAKKVGDLPLAVHILAKQLEHDNFSISRLHELLRRENSLLSNMYYGDDHLNLAIAASYKKLNEKLKTLLISTSIFKGKDFSVKSVGYINGLSTTDTTQMLQKLADLSLVERSTKNRYRIHPAIRSFAREQLNFPRSQFLLKIAIVIFSFFSLWWVLLHIFLPKTNHFYSLFSDLYGILAIYGAICGLHTAIKWGGYKTVLGRAILMFSLGLFSQEFGQLIYSYYDNFTTIKVPYPSIGDIGYFGTIPLYIYGIYLLAHSSGIKIRARSYKKKIVALIIPVIMLSIGYILFLQNYHFDFKNPIKIFLDFGYPLGESIYISLAIITLIFSRSILDGIMSSKALLVLVALVAQFIADYVFLYSSGSFYPGDYIDYLYLISYFAMTVALLSLKSLQVQVKNM